MAGWVSGSCPRHTHHTVIVLSASKRFFLVFLELRQSTGVTMPFWFWRFAPIICATYCILDCFTCHQFYHQLLNFTAFYLWRTYIRLLISSRFFPFDHITSRVGSTTFLSFPNILDYKFLVSVADEPSSSGIHYFYSAFILKYFLESTKQSILIISENLVTWKCSFAHHKPMELIRSKHPENSLLLNKRGASALSLSPASLNPPLLMDSFHGFISNS